MANIDDKVVAMSFENDKFEAGVKTTINTLDKLKKSLQFTGASKGLTGIQGSINRTNFTPMVNGVNQVRARFSAMNVIASAILAHIAIRAFDAGARIAKALTIGPIIQGLDIYQTKLQAIQTILANTASAGTKMKDVTAALQQLNVYSNKTIYSFGQMTKNIGTFTAAGVGLKPAVSAIKGIANLAALSGSNSDQAATAMYQLSQAIAAGQVHLQDWNSVVNAGLGGSVFQRALVQTAVAMGKIKQSTVKLVGPMKNVHIAGEAFRQSLQTRPGKTSWLTSDVLTKTLATFTGDMTDAQLAATGFNKEQIKQIQATAKTALNAATQVKTFSQLMDVTKETIATGWARSFELIIGNLNQAKKLFTDISNAMSGVINRSAATRNKILADWSKLGGRTQLIKGLKNVFTALGDVLKPIREAFRDIFPRKTGKDLFNLTQEFVRFSKSMIPSTKTMDNLRRTFRGVFAVIDIGKQVIEGIIGVFFKLWKAIFPGNGSILEFTGNIGDFLVKLDLAIKKGHGLENFFNGLAAVLQKPIALFKEIGHAVANMFARFNIGHFTINMDIASKAASPFHKALDAIIQALQGLGPAINHGIQQMNFTAILAVIRTGLLAALVLMIRKFIDGTTLERTLGLFGSKLGGGFAKNLGGGILGNLSKAFGGVTGTLSAMQRQLQAKTLEEIAIAIALLAASVLALSLVKPKRLNAALGAIAIGFGELIGVMVVMNKLIDTKATIKLPVIAASLILMATAIDILAIAVFALGKLNSGELARGLGAIAILLGTLSIAARFLGKNAVSMAIAAVSMNAIAVALNIMALAVKQFGRMDLATLAKGLGGIAGALVAIAIGMRLMPITLPITAAGLVVVAFALLILQKAMAKFGAMDLKTIGKGLLGIGGGLVVIALAMKLMPKSIIITAAGLFVVALALDKIVSAVAKFGNMSLTQLAKGMISLAIALGILAVALDAMSGTLLGAAALTIAAVGIKLLSDALVNLGAQSWTEILKSLISLAAGLGLIAAAGAAITPAIPSLLGFGAALILIGAGLALAGAGVALIGIGLSSIAIAGPTAVSILIHALIDLSKSLAEIGKNVILGLLEIVQMIAKVAPKFAKAAVKIIDIMAKATIKSSPKIAEALVVMLVSALDALAKHAPEIIQAGINIIEDLLKGMAKNIGTVVTMAVSVIVNFVNSLAKNANRLIKAGGHLVISIVAGIANNIRKLVTAGVRIVGHLVTGLVNAYTSLVKAGTNAIAHFVIGVANAAATIIRAGVHAAGIFINAIVKGMLKFEDEFVTGVIRFLNGTARIIRKREPQVIAAFIHIGEALGQGLIDGVKNKIPSLHKILGDLAHSAKDKLTHPWKIFSPSKVTTEIGENIIQGLINGIKNSTPAVHAQLSTMNTKLMDALNNVGFDHKPKISPVLDLTDIQNGSKKLDSLINKNPVGTISLSHAATISGKSIGKNAAEVISGKEPKQIKFEQNNYSPRELPPSEIYRRTRNQLSQLKLLTE